LKFVRYPNIHSFAKPSVLTIGNFDGVHIGHQALISKVRNIATKKDLEAVVVSMQPLASEYFAGKGLIPILTPFKSKYHLVKTLQVDKFCVLNFNAKLSELSATEFIQKILIEGLNAKHIVVGDDFRFGKNRQGDYTFLKQYCETLGIEVNHIETVLIKQIRISSSNIRKFLTMGNFSRVEEYLGRKYSISGKVSKGQQLGRKLNFPTINIKLGSRVLPLQGIFCVKVYFENGQKFNGAASIGTRPTVNGTSNILEVHILDFNKQVYGQNVEVFFYHKLRNEVKFDGLDELKQHIKQDVIKTRLFFDNKI